MNWSIITSTAGQECSGIVRITFTLFMFKRHFDLSNFRPIARQQLKNYKLKLSEAI
jgi:hypothetical protein